MINHRIICVPLCGWISISKSVQVTQVLDQRIEYGRRFLGKAECGFIGALFFKPLYMECGCILHGSGLPVTYLIFLGFSSQLGYTSVDGCETLHQLIDGLSLLIFLGFSLRWCRMSSTVWAICWLVVTGTCCILPYTEDNHPNWLSYFSDGLKPPTSSDSHCSPMPRPTGR